MRLLNGGANGRQAGMDAPIQLTAWDQSYNGLKIAYVLCPVSDRDIIMTIQGVSSTKTRIQFG